MKFGKRFLNAQVEHLSYLDYKALKKLIKGLFNNTEIGDVAAVERAFEEELLHGVVSAHLAQSLGCAPHTTDLSNLICATATLISFTGHRQRLLCVQGA